MEKRNVRNFWLTLSGAPVSMRAIAKVLALILGFTFASLTSADEEPANRELEVLVHKIEALENDESEIQKETVKWLMDIVSSDDISYHRPFVLNHGRDGTLYHPLSTYAIWALSSLIDNAPYTYADKDWEIGAHMTGERVRWMNWWKKSDGNYTLKAPVRLGAPLAVDLEGERRRQDENLEKYFEISRLQAAAQARGEYLDYFELERKVLFRNSKSLPNSTITSIGGIRDSNEAKNEEGELRKNNSSSTTKYESTQRPSKWPLVFGAIAVLGILLLLLRAFLRGRALR